MYNSIFGAGSGSGAFAYDMLVMQEIEKENKTYSCHYEDSYLKPCECQAMDCEDCEYYEED